MRPINNNEKWQPESADLVRKMILQEWLDGCGVFLGLFNLGVGEEHSLGSETNYSPTNVPVICSSRWGLAGLGLLVLKSFPD